LGEEPVIRPRESLALYKSFNILWLESLSAKSENGDVANGTEKIEGKKEIIF
jgi:hypothetical protein